MIYMRDRLTKRKGHDLTKCLIVDEIKQKIAQGQSGLQSSKIQLEDKIRVIGQNELKEGQRELYQIGRKRQQSSRISMGALHEQRLCESIVIEDGQKKLGPDFYSRKKSSLAVEKCFDIQLVNMLGSKVQLQAYIKVIEKENEELKREVGKLVEQVTNLSKERNGQGSLSKVKDIEFRLLQESIKSSEREAMIGKYQRYFEEGKSVLLKASMELIDSKNMMGVSLSSQRMAEKQQELARCLERCEKIISIYNHFLQEGPKGVSKDTLVLEQLDSIVKCQSKTIQKLTESRNGQGQLYHENMLLRYQTNRLTLQNEQLIGQLTETRRGESRYATKKKIEQVAVAHEQHSSFCQTEEKEQTPINKLTTEAKSPLTELSMVDESIQQDGEEYWREQLAERDKLIKNLEVEKEYISDQLISVETDYDNLKKTFRATSEEKNKVMVNLKLIEEEHARLQTVFEVSQQQENVMTEQVSLLKEKIKQSEERGEFRGSSARSRYAQLSEPGQSVTVQILLKFLKRTEQCKYHKALMELITRYELKISELNNSYMEQKEMKDRLLGFSRGLYAMVTYSRSLSLQEIVLEISKYEEVINHLRENQIDKLLRRIKNFSIGIDNKEFENIRAELEEYVYQLQARLPSLSEEYFQDGSSVCDSFNASLQRYEV